MSIEKRAFSGAFSGALNIVFTMGQGILLVPILLHAWGKDAYGVWLAVSAALGLLISFDVGHQNYLGNHFNQLHVMDLAAGRRALGSALVFGLVLGGAELLLTGALIYFGSANRIMGLEAGGSLSAQANTALFVLMLSWIFNGSLGGIIVRLYAPKGLFARGQWLGLIGRLLQLLTTATVTLCGGGIIETAVWVSMISICYNLILYVDVWKMAPEYRPWFASASFRLGSVNFAKSSLLVGNSILQQLSANGITMLVATTLTASALPGFATSRTVSNILLQITNVVIQPLYPDFVRLQYVEDKQKIRTLLLGVWFITAVLINFSGVVLFPFLEPLYLLWTGRQLPFDAKLIACLLIAVNLKCFGVPFYSYLVAFNRLRAQVMSTIIQVGSSLLLAAYLLPQLGMLGIGIAILVGELLGSAIVPIIFAQKELSTVGAAVDWTDLLWYGVFSITSCGAIFAMSFSPSHYLAILIPTLLLLGALSGWQFSCLPGEMKTRLHLIVNKLKGRIGFA